MFIIFFKTLFINYYFYDLGLFLLSGFCLWSCFLVCFAHFWLNSEHFIWTVQLALNDNFFHPQESPFSLGNNYNRADYVSQSQPELSLRKFQFASTPPSFIRVLLFGKSPDGMEYWLSSFSVGVFELQFFLFCQHHEDVEISVFIHVLF